ncbi:Bug family tripartite tricarboxylate transporter substrate binding protein [Variovorax ginsengisoli]|uniref:Tripartite tricarboxylate transporter substrate binding protein n=1 Tax=Variovorax ginsengisoli TaxID=363844 RepID=A0ABT8SGZ6_9BURK|nr:tripartite tricarboxylate transporter substrate binding protein [Variovorax ginsengisoli]MDN8617596.1 tripartite tricarboxylate transporter substrate binding protein [Variovorax ginsengisoli]MDO1536766.1 tripartite tricarboxylate transporter substrate binding protein [Variovorax ginsengisoli]
MRSTRRSFLLLPAALGAAACWPLAAHADSRDTQPIRLVVPFGAGGVADLTARVVGKAMASQLGQPVVVDNRPGAGGVVAGTMVASAAPDGLTLLLMSNGTAVSEGLFQKLPFDTRKDFAPISLLGYFDLAIVVPEASPLRSLADLVAAAKARPGGLNIGTVNVGSTQHLSAELFKSRAGIDVQVVPFNGTPAVVTALRSGQIDAAVEILSPVMPQITGKALRAIAVMGERRNPALPNVPTAAEGAGLKGFDVRSWNALAAPGKTPRERVDRLNRAVRAALASAEVQQQLATLNVQPRAGTPEELAALLDSEIRRWSGVIAAAGIPRQ